MNDMIDGVKIKNLQVSHDDRGGFAELFRQTDDIFCNNFGQLSWSISHQGVAKAWHLHEKQTDWMCVICGDAKLVLHDLRPNSKSVGQTQEILMGESYQRKVVKVPPGVAHGYFVINGPMHMIYLMNREYDPSDELRISHDDPDIGYDWKRPHSIK